MACVVEEGPGLGAAGTQWLWWPPLSFCPLTPPTPPPQPALGAACSRSGQGHEAMSVAKGRTCAEPQEAPIGWR